MQQFAIIKNAPIPTPEKGRRNIYPFAQMEVGDAFDVPNDLGDKPNGHGGGKICTAQNRVLNAARHYRRKTGALFTTRRVDDGKTIRVWRTK